MRTGPFQRCGDPRYPEKNQTIAYWPWRDIIREERRALAYRDQLPKCTVCGQALMVGQERWQARDVKGALPVEPGRHWACA